jgi:hypothetical protein
MRYITKGNALEYGIEIYIDSNAYELDESYKRHIRTNYKNELAKAIMALMDELGYPVVINIQHKPICISEDNPRFHVRRTIVSATGVKEHE